MASTKVSRRLPKYITSLGALESYVDLRMVNRLYKQHGKIRVIFLDIDGVLNSNRFYTSRDADPRTRREDIYGDKFCPISKKWINKLIDETGAYIVISSTWRHMTRKKMGFLQTMRAMWKSRGMSGQIIGITPSFYVDQGVQGLPHTPSIPRGLEIEYIYQQVFGHRHWQWEGDSVTEAKKKCKLKSYVIIDDDGDMLLYQKDNFVKCNYLIGFMSGEYRDAKKILMTDFA